MFGGNSSNQTVAGLKLKPRSFDVGVCFCSNQTVAGLKRVFNLPDSSASMRSNQTVAGLKHVSAIRGSSRSTCSNQTVAGLKLVKRVYLFSCVYEFKSDRCGIETELRYLHIERS